MVNPKQIEFGKRLDEMFELACLYQKDYIEQVGEDKYGGIDETFFKAKYIIEYKAGEYAVNRYFKNFVLAQYFKQSMGMKFKVNDKPYQEWLKNEDYRP